MPINSAYDDSTAALRVNIVAGGTSATGNVTLAPSPNFIGIVTVANSQANSGNVTLNTSPNFIGLVTSVTTGNVADNAANSGNPILTGGVYYATATVYDDKDRTSIQADVNGNLKETLGTLIAGEDLTNNRLLVQISNSYTALVSLTTINIKSGAGVLHTITVGGTSLPTVNIWDSLTATGTLIGTIQANPPVTTLTYDVSFATGLTVQPLPGGGIIPNYTISWK